MIVYLIQPGYCHGAKRYKIGMSTDESLTRVARGYPKNSTIFCIAGTFDNPRVVENDLIQCFCNRFKTSECGREYFEGSLREMIELFNATVDKHRKYNEVGVDTVANIRENFVKIDDNRWECKQCYKTISSRSKKLHFEKTCRKGLSILQCEFCHLICNSRDSKWRHKRTCTKKPKEHNKVNDFGHEDLTNLLSLKTSFSDAIQLVYFNKDYPANQTVRKRVKRDHSMEVMENNQWKSMLCSQGIPIIRERLKECGYECSEQMTDPDVRELLYNHTKHRE